MHAAHHLVLDIGNTRTKLARFHGRRLVAHEVMKVASVAAIIDRLGPEMPDAVGIGSVGAAPTDLIDALKNLMQVVLLTGSSPSPLTSAYTTPQTLGVDRLANAIAATQRFPMRAVLAIDIGTCITYDMVDVEGQYRGGAISPGLEMRAKAMHAHSHRLPLLEDIHDGALFGTTTEESLRSGVWHGLRNELMGMITAMSTEVADTAVILTGGGALSMVRAMKSGIFADHFLTLRGLHALLLHSLDHPGHAGTVPDVGSGTGLE